MQQQVVAIKLVEVSADVSIAGVCSRHDRELAKVKDMITTQEKIRREKWIDEKTKKIKVEHFSPLLSAMLLYTYM